MVSPHKNREIALQNGCIFVMEGTLLPPALRCEGQPYPDGWRLLKSVKSDEVDLRARNCGWNYFFVGGAMRRTVVGFGRAWSLRRATDQLLAEARKNAFNSVELTQITARQFLGLHWVSVAAHSRSLQKSRHVRDISARRGDPAMAQPIPGAERI